MLFSGITDAARLPRNTERRDKRIAPIISAAIRTPAIAIIQPRPLFSRTTGAVAFRAWRNFCGTSGLPASSVNRLTTETRTPCFHFDVSQIVQMPFPMTVLFQVFGHVFRNQDVPGVATIHDPLGNVNAGTGD